MEHLCVHICTHVPAHEVARFFFLFFFFEVACCLMSVYMWQTNDVCTHVHLCLLLQHVCLCSSVYISVCVFDSCDVCSCVCLCICYHI